jgi:hypothetical protein
MSTIPEVLSISLSYPTNEPRAARGLARDAVLVASTPARDLSTATAYINFFFA